MPLSRLALAIALTTLTATGPAMAEDGHDHVSGNEDIRVLHAWTAAGSGDTVQLYMEIENNSDATVALIGAEAESGAQGGLVGAPIKAGGDTLALQTMEIPAGGDLLLSPETVYAEIEGLDAPRNEGEEMDVHLLFQDMAEVEVHVEILEAGATRHPHAGHAH